MNNSKFTTGQKVYDPRDTYVYLIISGRDNGNTVDNTPIYKAKMFARNSGRFIGNTIIAENYISLDPSVKNANYGKIEFWLQK